MAAIRRFHTQPVSRFARVTRDASRQSAGSSPATRDAAGWASAAPTPSPGVRGTEFTTPVNPHSPPVGCGVKRRVDLEHGVFFCRDRNVNYLDDTAVAIATKAHFRPDVLIRAVRVQRAADATAHRGMPLNHWVLPTVKPELGIKVSHALYAAKQHATPACYANETEKCLKPLTLFPQTGHSL
jgi:hypothetical protein